MLAVALAGVVFPVPTFVTTLLFVAGRVGHQIGYSSSGYGVPPRGERRRRRRALSGQGHALGFVLSLLATLALEGLVLVIALRQLGAL